MKKLKNESQEIIEENLSNIVREEALEEVKSLDEDIASSFVLQLDQGMVNDEILRKNEIVQEDFNEDHQYDEDGIELRKNQNYWMILNIQKYTSPK